MALTQRVAILGSTGSVGTSTLDVMARHPDRFEVFALTAATQVELLFQQCARFQPKFAVLLDSERARFLQDKLEAHGSATRVLVGASAIAQVASHEHVDTVMAAIVGAAGLEACMAAALAGKRLLLANKEALVVGGSVFMDAVARGSCALLPIDSEHSAIFQCLPADRASWPSCIDKIILTASGGPFRSRDPSTFGSISPAEACAHPNWVMGRKISVDSATMMNKALEVIEASYLFGVVPEQLEVVIHPQSVIHSMVQFHDQSVLAQLGTPDMRGPIAYGLSWPDRMVSGAKRLDFSAMSDLTFEAIADHGHPARFPGLALAWDVLRAPLGSTAILNAANEVAVEAFLNQRIGFDQIHAINAETLSTVQGFRPNDLRSLLALDASARVAAQRIATRLTR